MSIYKPRKFWCFKCKKMKKHFHFTFARAYYKKSGWYCIDLLWEDDNSEPVGEPTIETESPAEVI